MYCMIYSILLLHIDHGHQVGPILCKPQVPLSRPNPSSKSLNSRNHSQHLFKVISFSGEAVCPVQPNFRLRSKTTSSSIKLLTSRVSCLIRVFALDFLTWISCPFYSRIFVSIAKPCPSSFETRVNAGLNSTPVVKNVLLDSSWKSFLTTWLILTNNQITSWNSLKPISKATLNPVLPKTLEVDILSNLEALIPNFFGLLEMSILKPLVILDHW